LYFQLKVTSSRKPLVSHGCISTFISREKNNRYKKHVWSTTKANTITTCGDQRIPVYDEKEQCFEPAIGRGLWERFVVHENVPLHRICINRPFSNCIGPKSVYAEVSVCPYVCRTRYS